MTAHGRCSPGRKPNLSWGGWGETNPTTKIFHRKVPFFTNFTFRFHRENERAVMKFLLALTVTTGEQLTCVLLPAVCIYESANQLSTSIIIILAEIYETFSMMKFHIFLVLH